MQLDALDALGTSDGTDSRGLDFRTCHSRQVLTWGGETWSFSGTKRQFAALALKTASVVFADVYDSVV